MKPFKLGKIQTLHKLLILKNRGRKSYLILLGQQNFITKPDKDVTMKESYSLISLRR